MANEGVEDSSWAQNGDEYEVTEDIEVIQNSDNAQDINLSSSVALEASGDSASIADGASEDVGDYDPESVDLTPLPQLEPAQSRQSSPNRSPRPASNPVPVPKKRKTAGGFLVGDSDSEDDTPAPTSTGSHPPPGPSSFSHVAPQPVAQSPLRTSVPIHEAQEAVSNVPSTPQGTMNALAVPAKAQPGSTETVVQSTEAYEPPQDFVTTLEERIKQDPKAALDAWLELIAELRRRNDIDALRDVYERFLAIFPQSADIWTAYMEMELELNNFGKAEDLFKKTLTTIQNVKLLTVYLDYIRRRNDLSDPSGRAREVVTQSFEFVLNNDVIGVDRDSGPIWTEYIQFIKTGPGSVGDQDWESKKKMDSLRRVYQRAIAIPTKNLNTLWREYEQFENSIDRKLGRAMVSQHSPSYMSAKSANMALDNITRRLQRSNLPRLPPAPGFDGDEEYMEQVDLWKRWIDWEKSDPLELATDEPATLKSRILYIYRQALMALRFWPDMWVEAAEWCWENDVGGTDGRDQGLDFLLEGIEANPENVLLALKHGDRVEGTYPVGEGDEAKVDRGNAVRAPYIKVQDSLYELAKKFKEEEKAAIDRINSSPLFAPPADKAAGEDDEDADASGDAAAKEAAKQAQIKAIQQGFSVRNNVLSKTISYVWIALARAMRRVQGTGAPQAPIGGLRHVFWEARQRGKLSSDVYVAVALMEWKVYKDNAGAKIFERGAKLFPEDEYFIVEYLKFLHSRDDFTNARVAFENCAKRLTEKPSTIHKARAIFSYFHKYESDYGDRSQIVKLEQRMAELFPDDPKLKTFAARFSSHVFDPITTRIIISPYQMRPKNILPSIEQQQQQQQQRGGSIVNSPRPSIRQPNSPRPQHFMPMMTNSPKRPLPQDEFDDAINPPRKMQRGESPLKGAAGRRLDQQRRVQAAPIARDITFLLGLLPTSSSYTLPRFNAAEMVRLVNNSHIPEAKDWKGGNNPRVQMPPTGGAAASHNRQISASYATRDSPTTATRTQSPFDNMSRGRIATAASTYHQPSGLRPGSSSGGGGFDAQAAAAAGMGVYPPPGSAIPTPDASGIWGVVPPGYGAPPPPPSGAGGEYGGGYGQAPPYGRYY